MDDRNRNGIPDDQERRSSRGGTFGKASGRPGAQGGRNLWDTANAWNAGGGNPTPYQPTQNSNFFTDVGRGLGNFFGPALAPGTQQGLGTGFGDYLVGSDPNRQPTQLARRKMSLRGAPQAQQTMQETALPDLQSFLSQAMEILGGTKEVPGVDYDPLRNDARSRSAEIGARLSAKSVQHQG